MTPPERAPSKVTVEDLLRLKRAERPPAEFWSKFDSQLRAKQLAAIVKRDPWWKSALLGGWGGLRRHQAALGGVAAVALLLVTVREYRGFGPAPLPPGAATVGEDVVRSEADVAAKISSGPTAFVADLEPANVNPANVAINDVASPSALVSAEGSRSAQGSPTAERDSFEAGAAPALAALADSSETVTFPAPSTVAPAGMNTGSMAQLVSASRGFDSRVNPGRAPIAEPLAQVVSPRDVRRARLLAAILPTDGAGDNAAVSSERVSDRVREQQLFETVSRMGRVGDPFTLRF